jgi:RNA polymerase primary sigma factor
MPKAPLQDGNQPVEDAGKPKENGLKQGRAASTPGRSKRKVAQTSSEARPKFLLADESYLEDVEPSLTPHGEPDTTALDDLDATERFDIGETLKNRGASALAGGSIVELLEEAYDRLALDDADISGSLKPLQTERGASSTKRNGHTAGADSAGNGVLEITEEIFEVEVVEVVAETPDLDESEPDPDELARAATEVQVVEEERPEELERAIERVLSTEGVSVDDPVRIYLREIGRTALLKSPDESDLAAKMALAHEARTTLAELKAELASGAIAQEEYNTTCREYERIIREGNHAKELIVQANLRLVVSIARRYIGRGLSLLDLVQEGNIGLMKAADKFDYRKGFKFSTYATWWIRQAITRAISDQSRTIRLPVHVTEMVTKLRRAAHELQQTLLREPTEEELGQALNMSAERVRKVLDMARHPASLDAPMEEGEDSFLGDFIEDERTGAPEEEASRQMLKEQVEDILSKLTERERQILQMRFGLTDDRPRTLEEVAKEFGITRERIRQIETRILRKLRYARYGASKLRGYLD